MVEPTGLRSRTASRRIEALALGFLACLGLATLSCRESAPAGDSSLDLLAQGTFLTSGEWIDFRQRHAESEAHSGLLPLSRLATVSGDWGGEESWGAWGTGERTQLHFSLRWHKDFDFLVRCRAAEHADGRLQNVTVLVNDREIGAFEAGQGWQTHRLEVSSEILRLGDNRVELLYSWHLEGDPAVDPRPRALAFEAVGLVPRGRRPPTFSVEDPGFEIDTAADSLTLTRSGTWLMPLSVEDGALLELSGQIRGRGARWRYGLMTLAGGADGEVPLEDPAADGWLLLDFTDFRDREVFWVVDVDLPRGGELELRYPRLSRSSLPADPAPVVEASKERPDIVMVVLDAARADRFGVYGYSRDTTPNLDRLAEESLVFDAATAECPYTTCSMPNLLAGLSFPQHGVLTRSQQLADGARTLAEELRQEGYQTFAWTGNPNSSPATGVTQGFDEIYEIWRLTEGRDRTHPGFLTDHVLARLTAASEQPFFGLLHYVPPHEPYDPDPELDVFGDPAYAGPVIGDQSFVQSVFRREIELDEADMEELSALYDGNLLMADHAVGRLIAGLQEAGRWNETLFVLTSDHGEAFGEHGFVGHNETLYEETLRVPLIVRLPEGMPTPTVDLSRLATLGDVMPTLLRLLRLPVPVEASGVDLLSSATSVSRDRLIPLTSAPEVGTFGARTQRFKLMARKAPPATGGWIRLFDLETDPGETRDLASEERLLQAALALRLERALASSGTSTAAEAERISEEDREMLESLGYL